ncbi:MAG: S8 family serine peptidase, partial [bacterium]|nr:S8 family serine peptidase [bacterium]
MRTKKLKFRFQNEVDANEGDYSLTVTFKQGCSAVFELGVLEDGFPVLETDVASRVNADMLHAQGITGAGVTIAFVDTGNSTASDTIHYNAAEQWRFLAQYDAINGVLLDTNDFGPANPPAEQDINGHGGHLASVALSAKQTMAGTYNGVAPGADMVSIKAFDVRGDGTYADIINGIQFAVDFQAAYGIEVLNLAFNGPSVSYYWQDPLNLAVTAAWDAGLVVVTSAGNGGPDPMTVGVPGNNPYAVTTGAMSDGFTPGDDNDDFLTSFSAAGPTFERFIKPDVVAPGGHVLGMASYDSFRGLTYPGAQAGFPECERSGTSPAAAITSGVVARMREDDPALTNDDVKCRLI